MVCLLARRWKDRSSKVAEGGGKVAEGEGRLWKTLLAVLPNQHHTQAPASYCFFFLKFAQFKNFEEKILSFVLFVLNQIKCRFNPYRVTNITPVVPIALFALFETKLFPIICSNLKHILPSNSSMHENKTDQSCWCFGIMQEHYNTVSSDQRN